MNDMSNAQAFAVNSPAAYSIYALQSIQTAATGLPGSSSIQSNGITVVLTAKHLNLLNNPSITVAAEADLEDTDNDGLPDEWELDYLGNLNSSRLQDPDLDGASNYHEFVAGTNPLDATSLLKALVFYNESQDRFELEWDTVTGKTYQLQGSANLKTGWTNLTLALPGTGEPQKIFINRTEDFLLFRVAVVASP